MSSSISVKVNAAGRSLPELTIPEGAGRSGRTLRFRVPANSRVEMLDPLTGLGPEQIQVKRVGQALHVAFKGSDLAAPDLVLEDFFKGKDEDRSRLLGKISGNDTQDYVPADSSTGQVSDLAEGGRGSTYTLHDAAHAAVAGGGAGAATGAEAAAGAGGLGTLGTVGVVAGVVVVAGVAAGGGGGGGDAAPGASSDTQAPAAPGDVRVLAQADGRVLVTGVAEAGSTVIIRFPDGTDKTAATQADGRFEVSSDAVQSSGNVSAQARDAAGNTGPAATTPYADTTAPAAPTLEFQANADGTATASGTAEAGARVEIRFPNETLVAVLADANGHFGVTSAGVSGIGNGSAVAIDAAGNASARTTAALNDDAPPSATATITGAVDDFVPLTGALASGAITNDRTPLLEGRLSAGLDAGSTLVVLRNGQQAGQAQLTGTRWTFQDTVRTDGLVSYTVQAVDAAGNRGAVSAPFTLNIDSTPPGAPTIDQALSNAGGPTPMKNGGATPDATPTLQGSLPAVLAPGQVLEILRDGVVVRRFDQSGTAWSFDDQPLADGTYTYRAQVREASTGELSQSNTFTLTIDHTPPRVTASIQTLSDDVPLIVDTLSNGAVTNDTTPLLGGTLTGPLAAGEQVLVLRDGLKTPLVATVNGTTWSVQETGLQGGQTYTYHASVVDAAGNTGPASEAFRIEVDTAAPNQSSTIELAEREVGGGRPSTPGGGTLATDSPAFLGHLSAALATGERLVVYRDGLVAAEAETHGTLFEFADQGLRDGSTYRYTTRVEDGAGNQGTASAAFVLSIDTSPPQQSVSLTGAIDDIGSSTGTVASGGRTDDPRPALQGTLSASLAAGESITILRDGQVIASGLRPAGQNWTYTHTQDLGSGTHTFSAQVVNAADVSGPASAAFELTESQDPAKANAVISAVYDDQDRITGVIASGSVTNDTSPTIRGTLSGLLERGEAVYVYREGLEAPLSAKVDAKGNWAVGDDALRDGQTYHYQVVVALPSSIPELDRSGLWQGVPVGYQIAVDAAPPVHLSTFNPVLWAPTYGSQSLVWNALLRGGFDNGDQLAPGEAFVIFRKDGTEAEVEIARFGSTGAEPLQQWTHTDTLNHRASVSYFVRVVDAAGNMGPPVLAEVYGLSPFDDLQHHEGLAIVHEDLMWVLPSATEPSPVLSGADVDHAAGQLQTTDLLHLSSAHDIVI